MRPFEEGEWVLLVSPEGEKEWISQVGRSFSTAEGTFDLKQLIGKVPGSPVQSHRGSRLYAFRPTPADWILRGVKRQTQVA
ncbi:MAG: hypothetical protein NZ959_08890, partial [Armatimonadetes bacterium]|nr:hypothetical protein [Armatimonadota bacterium]